MMRVVLFLIALLMPSLALAGVGLRDHVVINRDTILLGDLFVNLPANVSPDNQIGTAPPPGEATEFDATALANVAAGYNVGWTPDGSAAHVSVRRAVTIVSTDMLHQMIASSLAGQNLPPNSDFQLDNPPGDINVPPNQAGSVALKNLSLDLFHQRFQVTLTMPGDDGEMADRELRGRLFQTINVPVPSRPIEQGTVIRPDDVTIVQARSDQLNPNQITDINRLVGMNTLRGLPAGLPVRVSDVSAPLMVMKNNLVDVKVTTEHMVIVMEGKVLDNGAMGETVRVQNPRSEKMLQAVVTGPGEVSVRTAYSVASQ